MTEEITWQAADDTRALGAIDFKITRANKRQITGALWLPNDGKQTDTLVCCGHGGSGDRFQSPIPQFAARFADQRVAVLAIDGPDHGLRQHGPGGRAGLMIDLQRGDQALDDMSEDWRIAVDAVRSRDDLELPRLAYFGLSMGSIYGIPFLAQRDDLIAAVLGLHGVPEGMPHANKMMDAASRIEAPVHFLLQLDDEVFATEDSIRLFRAIGSYDKRMHGNPGKHADIARDEIEHCFDYLQSHISGNAAKREIVTISQ